MDQRSELVVSLTDPSLARERVSPARVGGKASSLARLCATEGLAASVPRAHALTVDFFAPWIAQLAAAHEDFGDLAALMDAAATGGASEEAAERRCARLQADARGLALAPAQAAALAVLAGAMAAPGWGVAGAAGRRLAAVRSSAPEEDGAGASFAGAFETRLGVAGTVDALAAAVQDCFASLWDYRVLHYRHRSGQCVGKGMGFCVVVMEVRWKRGRTLGCCHSSPYCLAHNDNTDTSCLVPASSLTDD